MLTLGFEGAPQNWACLGTCTVLGTATAWEIICGHKGQKTTIVITTVQEHKVKTKQTGMDSSFQKQEKSLI